jgi:hypothetical protein
MSRNRFWSEILASLQQGESPDDVAEMIDILAVERRRAAGPTEGEDEVSFAAGIVCVLLKWIKPQEYQRKMSRMRYRFDGIARDPRLQTLFRSSFTPALLTAPDAQHAISLGFDALFQQPQSIP